jgi:hypothetical protein
VNLFSLDLMQSYIFLCKQLQVSKSFDERSKVEPKVQIIKLTEERTYALQQNEKLRQELALLKKERNRRGSGFTLKFLLIVGLLGALAGYIMKRT